MDIKSLNHLILNDIYNLLNKFGLEYTEDGQKILMRCPIHQGDKPTGCSIYKDTGRWFCWTHNCHIDLQSNLFAFFKALLKTDTGGTIQWFQKYFGNIQVNIESNTDILTFVKGVEIVEKKLDKTGILRDNVVKGLKIPSRYFVGRGFKVDTLIKYDVGECLEPGKHMYNRAVVPVYDIDHKIMTGCVGRRLTEDDKYPKWINSKNFKRGDNLYNIWYAKEEISKTGTVILCEGQGDVWRLEEAGIHNAVGIFGSSLTDNQMVILESLPIFNMIILTDSDDAGIAAREKIIKQCSRLYNIYTADIPKKDIGEMSIAAVKELLCPMMEKI